MDIWADAGTPVYVPLAGHIHSFRDNNNHGDYGATIILQHQLGDLTLYSLFGHLSRRDLEGLSAGDKIEKGQKIASFGNQEENGHWPPHLHFQSTADRIEFQMGFTCPERRDDAQGDLAARHAAAATIFDL